LLQCLYGQLEGSAEAASKCSRILFFEGSQPCFVEGRGSIFLDSMAESVGIVVHPRQKPRSGFVRFGAGGLTSFDPEADEFMRELPETAVRIIEFICLCMAARKERLVEPYSALGSVAPSLRILAATSSSLLTKEKPSL
jgi:hypothetical protein